jgi:hypothetical protein
MRRYVQITGAFFALGAIAQLLRAVSARPMRVADFDVPVWCSGLASVAGAAMAAWAFHLARAHRP